MKWRTDKPTADVIVADVFAAPESPLHRFRILIKPPYGDYMDCNNAETIDYALIIKWADLEEDKPVTDCNELKKAAEEYAKDETMAGLAERAFKAGANWQREQDHDACRQCEKDEDITFYKGMQHAMEMMKEEAIERTVKEDAGGYPYIDETELYDYETDEPTAKKGDRVKVYIFR